MEVFVYLVTFHGEWWPTKDRGPPQVTCDDDVMRTKHYQYLATLQSFDGLASTQQYRYVSFFNFKPGRENIS